MSFDKYSLRSINYFDDIMLYTQGCIGGYRRILSCLYSQFCSYLKHRILWVYAYKSIRKSSVEAGTKQATYFYTIQIENNSFTIDK